MMLSEHEIYVKVKELLSTREKWTTGAFAKDLYGTPVGYTSENACSFCLRGALNKVCSRTVFSDEIPSLYETIKSKLGFEISTYPIGLATFNDSRTYEEMIEVLDEAIEMTKEQQNVI
jgi:hypothetical protein